MSSEQARFEFDANQAELAKNFGMNLAESEKQATLEIAREIAEEYAKRWGRVSADYVHRELFRRGYGTLGQAAGKIFIGPKWIFTGIWHKSERVSNHGRPIRVWRLKV